MCGDLENPLDAAVPEFWKTVKMMKYLGFGQKLGFSSDSSFFL